LTEDTTASSANSRGDLGFLKRNDVDELANGDDRLQEVGQLLDKPRNSFHVPDANHENLSRLSVALNEALRKMCFGDARDLLHYMADRVCDDDGHRGGWSPEADLGPGAQESRTHTVRGPNGLRLSGARLTPPSDDVSPRTVRSGKAARVRCSRGLGAGDCSAT